MREELIAVGVLGSERRVAWQSPDLPSPTLIAFGPTRGHRERETGPIVDGGAGWILVRRSR